MRKTHLLAISADCLFGLIFGAIATRPTVICLATAVFFRYITGEIASPAPNKPNEPHFTCQIWHISNRRWWNCYVFALCQASILLLGARAGEYTIWALQVWAVTLCLSSFTVALRKLFGGFWIRGASLINVAVDVVHLSGLLLLLITSLMAANAPGALSDGSWSSLMQTGWATQMAVVATGILTAFLMGRCVESHFPKLKSFMCVVMLVFHLFAVVGIYQILTLPPSAQVMRGRIIRDVFALYFLGGLGITAGAHRLWAHRAYKANIIVRIFLMMCQSLALQGCIMQWARDHRVHHRYSEKTPDPHNAAKGFFYAHMGWLLEKTPAEVEEALQRSDVSDLRDDPVVVFQHVLDPWWCVFWCLVAPSLYGMWAYGNLWLGLFTVTSLRWIITLHATWTVNSVAHLWGPKPYNPNIGAVESFVTALVANGEGWHNWHHQYAFDYATSEHGALRQYNPTKVIIDIFARIGWVWDRKRATKLWELTKKKQEERKRAALEAIGGASISRQASSLSLAPIRELHSPAKSSFVHVQALLDLIPAECYKLSIFRSTVYLLRDLFVVALVSTLTAIIWILVSRLQHAQVPSSTSFSLLLHFIKGSLFVLYSLAQGTVLMALWVAVYEASGGRFSRWSSVNGIVGAVLSIVLLIPYQGRRREGRVNKVHKRFPAAAHLCRALYDDVFTIFNVWRWTALSSSVHLPLGGITAAIAVGILTALVKTVGWRSVTCWYLGAWFVMNLWLLLYHHLLLTKVHQAFNNKHCTETSLSQEPVNRPVDREKTTEEILSDVVDDGQEDNDQNTAADALFVDPHSIQEIQPLTRDAVEFFTQEWFISAIHVFERAVLFPRSTKKDDDSPVCHVRFLTRLLLFLFGSLHHHLSQVNILQSIDLSIPHYHARAAVQKLQSYADAMRVLQRDAAEAASKDSSAVLCATTMLHRQWCVQ